MTVSICIDIEYDSIDMGYDLKDDSIDMEDDSIDMGYLVTLPRWWCSAATTVTPMACPTRCTYCRQGLTLVHFSAQRKRFLWDKGCNWGLFRGCSGGVEGYEGVFRVYFVLETAQVELNSVRV